MQLPQPLHQWFWAWVSRRAPRAASVRLRHKSIYVLPTAQGWGFLLVIALLWVLGTNYENNLVLGAAFLLLSLMVVSVVHAFRNLSGLTLSVVRTHPAFAGEFAEFDVLLEAAPGSRHDALRLGWDRLLTVEADVPAGGECCVSLSHKARRRGWLVPERLRIQSVYPLGFFRAWSWVQLDGAALIYPAPRPTDQSPRSSISHDEGTELSRENQEEFQGFRVYQAGSPLAHVAWKHYAREQGMHLKDYSGYQSEQVWLDWDALPGLDQESRLSRLCYWALAYGKTSAQYGLRLPGRTVVQGGGAVHQTAVLKALALYGLPENTTQRRGPGG